MPIELRASETIRHRAEFHWSTFFVAGACALAGTVIAIHQVYVADHPFRKLGVFAALLIGYAPLLYRWMKNRTKQYFVTNQRIYIDEGLWSKKKAEFPLTQILDLKYSHGYFQKFVGTGSVVIFTKNQRPYMLDYLDGPKLFQDRVIEMMTHAELERESQRRALRKTGPIVVSN